MSAEDKASTSSFEEWPSKAVDLVDLVVDTIRDKVVRPIILVGRTIVFGLLIAAVVVVVAVVAAVALLRLLDVYVFGSHVWASYAVLGALFSAAGLFAWSKRTDRSAAEDS
jgi:uncharacterized membrane protein YdjX (TVP38/TMEM64 family)